MMARRDHCCLCGAPRRPTQAPVERFGNNCAIVTIADHRTLQEGRWEVSPQMLVSVSMWRNGGTSPGETHMCDDCIVVGLTTAKRFIDDSLRGLGVEADEVVNARDKEAVAMAIAETAPSWKHRCHRICAAIGVDIGDPDFVMPEERELARVDDALRVPDVDPTA